MEDDNYVSVQSHLFAIWVRQIFLSTN